MQVINAEWERRNFGMQVYEILLDEADLERFDEVLRWLRGQNFKESYVVVKLPVGDLKALHALEDEGFRFLETQLFFTEHFTPKQAAGEAAKQAASRVTKRVVQKTKEAWERVIEKISVGMFATDRVSLDPHLGNEIAHKRYQNWCKDLFEKPNSFMVVGELDGEEYCFGIYLDNGESVDIVLNGIFESHKGLGLGGTLLEGVSPLKKTTTTSSNNPAAVKVYGRGGMIVSKELYVLRKIY